MRVAALGARNGPVQKTFWLAVGWTLVVIGVVFLPAPIPVPLIGIMPLLTGLAILTTHSKAMRRRLQYARHRFEWLSRGFERFAHRMPLIVKAMIHRTSPIAYVRQARLREHREQSK